MPTKNPTQSPLSQKASNPNEKYALLSVWDKTGIVDFAKAISTMGFRIISSGGTAKVLSEAGIKVVPIQDITGNPESFNGRMKTISFQIESGILYDRANPKHVEEAKELNVKNIELVVCNLYPFEKTTANPEIELSDAIESIDVGGPTMVRAAAKNFESVLVVVDPKDYQKVIDTLRKSFDDQNLKQALAAKAFNHLSFYDSQIAKFLSHEQFPEELALPGRKLLTLRYGENPHQKATAYFEPNNNSPLASLQRQTGRELSYVNFTDIAAGLESVRMFKKPAAVVIKHNSPSGVALGKSSAEALSRAVAADPESAFGGIVVLNKPLDLQAAKTFAEFKEENGVLIDIVAVPSIDADAKDFIATIRKSTGIYTFGEIPAKRSNPNHLRFFDGGFVMQDWDDTQDVNFKNWKIVTKKKPTAKQLEQMRIAWKFIARIKSNTIIVVDKDLPMTRGIGCGQTSRVRSCKIALEQAGKFANAGVLASDAFFPFDDSVKLAAKAGIAAIVQPGGSINDKLSIEATDKAGIAMVVTGERKFWH